jgi:ribose/xylose/arabinose/galactoside ABC-type transport system permease subunit
MSVESTPAENALAVEDPERVEAPVPHNGQSRLMLNIERFALPGLFALVLIFFSAWSTTGHLFGTAANFQEVASNYVYIGILTLASLIPLVCGEFDFSVGQNAGFTQIVVATAMADSMCHFPSQCCSPSHLARWSASTTATWWPGSE